MAQALDLARAAAERGEVPVGALLVRDDELVAEAANAPLSSNDPTAHAEIAVLRAAGQRLQNILSHRFNLGKLVFDLRQG